MMIGFEALPSIMLETEKTRFLHQNVEQGFMKAQG